MGVKVVTDSQARSFLEFSGNMESSICEKESSKSKSVSRIERWSKEQADILVNIQKTLHTEFGFFHHFKISLFLTYIFCI